MAKKTVTENFYNRLPGETPALELRGSIKEIQELLLKIEVGTSAYTNVRIQASYISIKGDRLETDAEYKRRLAVEKKNKDKELQKKEKQTAARRKKWEELNKEFGDVSKK